MSMKKIPLLVFSSLLLALGVPAEAKRWRGPAGGYLPFETDAEVLEFLSEAEVVASKEIPQGINKPLKLRLARNGVEASAVFRTVYVKKPRHETGGKVYVNFHDNYAFECAAYEVSRLLGLDNVPPCMVRTVGRREGTVQLWVEDAMTEEKRRKTGEKPPLTITWVRQQQTMRLFDALIYNFDRNQGNMLIDPDWKLWFIDHTRSFHASEEIEKLERIVWVDRVLWQNLRKLDRETLERRIAHLVDEDRLEAVLKRRDRLVAYLEEKIAQVGEDAVVFDMAVPAPDGIEATPDYALASTTDDIPEESPPIDEGGGGGLRDQ